MRRFKNPFAGKIHQGSTTFSSIYLQQNIKFLPNCLIDVLRNMW